VRIQKILYYIGVMAEATDVEMLLNTGVVRVKSRKRARKTAKPAIAN
jgi:hypothetical protein